MTSFPQYQPSGWRGRGGAEPRSWDQKMKDGITAELSAGSRGHHGDAAVCLTKGRWRWGDRSWLPLSPTPQFPEVPPIGQTYWEDLGGQECSALRYKTEPGRAIPSTQVVNDLLFSTVASSTSVRYHLLRVPQFENHRQHWSHLIFTK